MPEVEGKWSYRVALTSTVKEGYRVGDASVTFTELEGLSGATPGQEIKERLYQLVKDGEMVAERLNNDKTHATAESQGPSTQEQSK